MRVFLGIILGIVLTIGGAYVFDSVNNGPAGSSADAGAARKPMVNWDVVDTNWHAFTVSVRTGWHRLEHLTDSR
jgi:hypothetical protein